MVEIIRKIKEEDFEKVASLYKHRKSVEELKWLFSDPHDVNTFNAYVAIIEPDNLIGVIGYSLSEYTDGARCISGVMPISWKIAEDYKGFAGIQLFNKVHSTGIFGIAIGGSETSIKLYPMFKYKFLSNSFEYYKLLHVKNALLSLKRKTVIKSLGMIGYLLPTYFQSPLPNPFTKHIKLIPYTGFHFRDEPLYNNVFRKKISKEIIDWLLKCPKLKTYAFTIFHREVYLGVCVFYIQKINHFNRGRIVHLPFLGLDQDLWVAVLDHCIRFFKKENCCLITGLANLSINRSGYRKAGFMTNRNHGKPNFIKDSMANLSTYNLENWHLQYSEGDKGYRNI